MNTVIAFSVVFGIETFIICVGNAFAIFVFWTQCTGSKRRASYLLINLAVADFLIGISEPPSVITHSILPLLGKNTFANGNLGFFISSFLILFSAASVVSLAAISVERTFAVLWPLTHRTTSDRVYIYCVAFIWTTGIALAFIYTLPAFGVWSSRYAKIILNIVIVLCILTTCLTYTIIRAHLRRSPQIFNKDQRQNMERNVKLSKTLFMVIALSFACWVPSVALYAVHDFCNICIPAEVILVGNALHFGNSLVNPVAYFFRLSIFKKTLNSLLKRRQGSVELTKF